MSQVIGSDMVRRGRGKIISIASLLSFQGGLNVSAYTASKHAIAGLTKALANEWAAHNVQVNAIAPGYIDTANTALLRQDPIREPQIRQRGRGLPGRARFRLCQWSCPGRRWRLARAIS